MRRGVCIAAVLVIIMPLVIARAQNSELTAVPGTRNAQIEDAVAVLFERARTEVGSQPLSRIYRSDVEKLVCTASLMDLSHDNPMRLPLTALYKTDRPDKMNEALLKLAAYHDHVGFRRFAVAVWTAQPQTHPPQYWVGINLYQSPGAAFVENHFADQAFYKKHWKTAVVPQCKRASSK